MLQITGRVKSIGTYSVKLDMTEEQFYALPYHQQNQVIENAIDMSLVSYDGIELEDDADVEVL